MEFLSPTKWVQQVTKNCLRYISTGENIESLFTSVLEQKKLFELFSELEKHKVHKLIMEQFDVEDSILILSYIINILDISDIEFKNECAKKIYEVDYDSLTLIMLDMQLIFWGNISYRLRYDIHQKIIRSLEADLKLEYSYIPIESRNKNRIVVITEQLLFNTNHAPTMMTLETIYLLQKCFGYEVNIFTCPSNRILLPTIWLETNGFFSSGCGYQQYVYKGMQMPVYQYPMAQCSMEDYEDMLKKIYEFRPAFVLNMGVNNPIADIPHFFTTVVSRDMSTELSITEADIIVSGNLKITQNKDILNLKPYQKLLLMNQKFPVMIRASKHIYSREELHLPMQRFLIAIVGNRLDAEMDGSFKKLLFSVLEENSNIDFVIIGKTEKIYKEFSESLYNERVHFLGFCSDLLGVYKVLDLYLNPKRSGGGWSSAIALKAGIPVVTLQDCDVAYNVPKEFVVSNEQMIIPTILHYGSDKEYYKKQSGIAKKFGEKNIEEDAVKYVSELLEKIKEILYND